MAAITNDLLGKRLGVSHAMASRLRNGHRLPSVATMDRIRKEFGVDGDKLIDAHLRGSEHFGLLLRKAIDSESKKRAA